MKTLLGFAFLLITSISYSQNWIDASKTAASQEAGFRILNSGSVQYYLYSDNNTHDFNIQSTAVSGEGDATPRLRLPFASPNIYLGLSGGNVGIGTTSPGAKLDIAANNGYELKFSGDNGNIWGTNSLYFLANDDIYLGSGGVDAQVALKSGNFGIGNSNPSAKLHISNGDVLLQNSSSGYPSLYLKDVAGSNVLKFDYNSLIHSGGVFYIRSGGSSNLIINDGSNGGNVGIGTQTPDAKLSVNGAVHAKEVKVDLTGWPDYVFANDYNLQPLKEVKHFIEQNQHLPEMPSAIEVEANGVMLGEMNKLLLKKVEELTLHLIRQQEEIDALKKLIK
ncbi:MAG TPA: hypothetical protein PK185_11855 [Cyclobacteriaceae bacterium]|nr:hypothetical protein [Cyclobacteriaceae bacterium]